MQSIQATSALDMEALAKKCAADCVKSRTCDGVVLIFGDYLRQWMRIWARPGAGLEFCDFATEVDRQLRLIEGHSATCVTDLITSLPKSDFNHAS